MTLPKPSITLPQPNVEFAPAEIKPGEFNEFQVKGIICNPIYAGFGPYPAVINDEQWIAVALDAIEKEGPAQFLVNMLYVLRQTYLYVFPTNEDEQGGNNHDTDRKT